MLHLLLKCGEDHPLDVPSRKGTAVGGAGVGGVSSRKGQEWEGTAVGGDSGGRGWQLKRLGVLTEKTQKVTSFD